MGNAAATVGVGLASDGAGVGMTAGRGIAVGAGVAVGRVVAVGTGVEVGRGVCLGEGTTVGGMVVGVAVGLGASGTGCSAPQAKLIITINVTTVMDSSVVIFLMGCRLNTSPLLYGAD